MCLSHYHRSRRLFRYIEQFTLELNTIITFDEVKNIMFDVSRTYHICIKQIYHVAKQHIILWRSKR